MSNSANLDINWNEACEEKLREANGHIKFGAGVGIFGAASLAVLGATCPLCFFVAPAMMGLGVWKRRQAKQELEEGPQVSTGRGDDGRLPPERRAAPERGYDGNLE